MCGARSGTKEQGMMEQTSILVGRCYRDRGGVVYRVTSYDGQRVQFVVHPSVNTAGANGRPTSEDWQPFLQKLQGEVACPDS